MVVLPLEPVTSTVGTSCTSPHGTPPGSGSSATGQASDPAPSPTETLAIVGEEGDGMLGGRRHAARGARGSAPAAMRSASAAAASSTEGSGPPAARGHRGVPRPLVHLGGGVERVGRGGEGQAGAAGPAELTECLLPPERVEDPARLPPPFAYQTVGLGVGERDLDHGARPSGAAGSGR